MNTAPVLFAYFSPETVLPVTSIIATAVGLVMMFGRNTWRIFTYGVRRVVRRRGRPKVARGPHFGHTPAKDAQAASRRGAAAEDRPASSDA